MEDSYCTSCGAFNSVLQTSANQICGECGDTEGIIYPDNEKWEELTNND